MRDHILERLKDEVREFERALGRMTIRELETSRVTFSGPMRVTGRERLELWMTEVRSRAEKGRLVGNKDGLKAGPRAEAWECEPEGICEVTPTGVRLHDSVRQHGGEETARRVLVLGHRGIDREPGRFEDLFHLTAEDAVELRAVLDRFLKMKPVSGGGARRTAGDDACRALPPWVDPG